MVIDTSSEIQAQPKPCSWMRWYVTRIFVLCFVYMKMWQLERLAGWHVSQVGLPW
jgi:hypothetical protein